MKSCDIKFKINEEGYLLVSCDKGCTWENIGMVKGDASTVQGPQGEQGPQGPSGADGANGADGNTPYINELTGTWWIGTTDTGVVAEGANGEVDIEGSSDIAVVGTPSVTKRVVGNKTILKFHELKGERGDAPEITAERNDSTNSVTFSVDGVPVATIYDGIHYTAGSHIVITPTDTNHSVIACDLVAGTGININNNNEIELVLTVPTERNELIYSDDGSTLTTHPLMFTGGLVVDTPEDLALCEASADVTMSAVYSSWNPYGSSSDDKGKWGYCDSEGSGTTKNVVLVDGSTQAVPLYTFNGNPQGYIFNIKNTDRITGYYSDTLYSSYDSIVAAGIIPSLKSPGATDYMAIIPALYGDNEVFCGLSVSANNTINTSSDGRESVGSEGHTISVIAWTQSSPDAAVSSPTGAIQLLKNSEGLLISEYNSSLCNGTSSGTASTIQVRTQRRGNIITIWASDPYPTTDDDFTHRNDIHSDCPIVINLEEYTLSYTYKNSSDILTTVTKDFSDSANPPSGYTAANVTSIKAIFDKLKTSAKRGYEVCSNPGSIFRNVSSDELILDVTPGENKVYGFNGSTWQVLNTTPLAMFLNGSRIAWNRITDKLFYNDGSSIYRIASPTENTANDGKLTIKGNETTAVEFTANQSTNKTLKVKGSTGVTVSGTDGQITVSTESNHTVVSKTGIITGGSEHGSQAYELGVRCDLSGITVKAVDLEDFATTEYSTPRTFKWTKTAGDTGKYVGLFGVASTDACYVFKVLITNTVTNETESHLYGVIEDTPLDSTFLFVTTNSWPIVCKGFSTSMVAYMQIPDDFVGTIEVVPMRYKVRKGGNVFCFEPTGVSDGTPHGSGWAEDDTEVTLDFYTSSLIYGSDISDISDLRTPSGRYNVDVIGDFGGSIVVGSKIADSVINDYILHTLSKKVDSLVNSQSLTIGSTTITEAQLQALLATLQ